MHCLMRSCHTMRQGMMWVIATACKYACNHCGAGMLVCGKPACFLLIWQHLLEVYGSRSPIQSSTSCLEMLAAQEHKSMFHITKGWHFLCFVLDPSGPAYGRLCAPPNILCTNPLLWHVCGQMMMQQGQCPGSKLCFCADMRMYMWESLLSSCCFPTHQTFLLSR